MRWFDKKPLFGKRVLVTRSRTQASTLSQLLAQEGAEPIELPTIDIEAAPDPGALDDALARLSEYDWAIFTSSNGVEAFFQRIGRAGLDSRALHPVKVCAIGEATAQELIKHGIAADLVPQEYSSQGILHALKGQNIQGLRFLLARADLAGEDLAKGLMELGAQVDQAVAYRTVPAPEGREWARATLDNIDVITFTSSSTVRGLVNLLQGDVEALRGAVIACIGPLTAATASRLGLKVDLVAQEHTIPGLVSAMIEWFEKEAT